jgi:uncharacterized alkaline shock family protein YloU
MKNTVDSAGPLPAGRIEVLPRAMARIAARAAMVEGTVWLTPRDGTPRALPAAQSYRGVEVQLRGDAPAVEVFVLISYGARLAEVAEQARERVSNALEQALGVAPASVNVRVQGLRGPKGEGSEERLALS